jgi:hypothetical protein
LDGAVAQLGERVVRNDEVRSSILLSSTIGTIGIRFCRAVRTLAPSDASRCGMRRQSPQKRPYAISRDSDAWQLSIGLMAMAAAGLALFFLKAVPLDWRSQISFFCVL